MTHVVAGYPNLEDCLALMLEMQDAGVHAIEVQIPFTDPIADGETIMKANDIALTNGVTIESCFGLILAARNAGLMVPIYIMSYVHKVAHVGFQEFCEQAKQCQADGLIIPDLPASMPEFKALLKQCAQFKLDLVPVLSPGMADARLKAYKSQSTDFVYVTSGRGITGNKLALDPELTQLVEHVRSEILCDVALGFGIQSQLDVKKALEIADIAVVGSAVIREIEQRGVKGAAAFVKQLIKKTDHDN